MEEILSETSTLINEKPLYSGKCVLVQYHDSTEITKLPIEIAFYSNLIKSIYDTIDDHESPIPLSETVNKEYGDKIFEFCRDNYENPPPPPPVEDKKKKNNNNNNNKDTDEKIEEPTPREKEFLAMSVDLAARHILAASYLDIKMIVDMICKDFARQMEGKTPDEIREHFRIENDFTPEDLEEIRRENCWLDHDKK